jgi:hypothetical protein
MSHITRTEFGEQFENDHFLCCGKVRRVKVIRDKDTKKITEIEFFCERSSFVLKAVGDCCSKSWFVELGGHQFRDLVDKRIRSITMKQSERKFYTKNKKFVDEVVKDKRYTLKLSDDSDYFEFILKNSSDHGYYSGFIEVFDFKMNPTWDKAPITKNTAAQVTLIVGLPASGKSHLARTTFGGSIQLNDFYSDPQWRFKLEAYLQTLVCVTLVVSNNFIL